MTISDFGTTARGEAVQRITLTNGALCASVLTLGAALQGLWWSGIPHSLTLGSDRLADYEGAMRHHGVLVAPVVNRLSGGRAMIDGVLHRLVANQDGLHTLHSGPTGSHLQVWTLAEATETSATLTLTLPDGLGGFPGNRVVTAIFSVPDDATLRLQITARTDKPTLFNAANHSYWNLDGTPDWSGHTLQIDAARYLPTTASFAPTGEVRATQGSAFDFRSPRKITPAHPALDNAFCLSDHPRALTPVLTLTGQSRVSMTVATTDASIQVYDGRAAIRPGHGAYEGLAIEPQNWPDAPNHEGFPSIALNPGQTYRQTSEWRFSMAPVLHGTPTRPLA